MGAMTACHDCVPARPCAARASPGVCLDLRGSLWSCDFPLGGPPAPPNPPEPPRARKRLTARKRPSRRVSYFEILFFLTGASRPLSGTRMGDNSSKRLPDDFVLLKSAPGRFRNGPLGISLKCARGDSECRVSEKREVGVSGPPEIVPPEG